MIGLGRALGQKTFRPLHRHRRPHIAQPHDTSAQGVSRAAPPRGELQTGHHPAQHPPNKPKWPAGEPTDRHADDHAAGRRRKVDLPAHRGEFDTATVGKVNNIFPLTL